LYKVVLVTAGKPQSNYLALFKNDLIEIVGVIDINEPGFLKSFRGVKVYSNLKEIKVRIDYVFITKSDCITFMLAKEVLELGYNVLFDKLVTLDKSEFNKLLTLANQNNLKLKTVYPYLYAKEIVELEDHLELNQINHITISFKDKKVTNLFDQLIDIFSYLYRFMYHKDLELESVFHLKDEKGNIIYLDLNYQYKGISIEIELEITKHSSHKISKFNLKDDTSIKVIHNRQLVNVDGSIYQYPYKDRIKELYLDISENIFEMFQSNMMVEIHNKLSEVLKET